MSKKGAKKEVEGLWVKGLRVIKGELSKSQKLKNPLKKWGGERWVAGVKRGKKTLNPRQWKGESAFSLFLRYTHYLEVIKNQ